MPVVAALIVLFASFLYMTAVFKGIGNLLETFLDLPYRVAILIVFVIVVIYTAVGGFISVVRTDGTDAPGWPAVLPIVLPNQGNIRDFLSSPAVGDVDLDGSLDVVLGWTDGAVHAWTGETGALLPGFPATLIDAPSDFDLYLHSPTLGNIDGDANPEILVSSGDGRLAAANHDGSPVPRPGTG